MSTLSLRPRNISRRRAIKTAIAASGAMLLPSGFHRARAQGALKQVSLALRKSAGGMQSGVIFLRFDFKLAAVKTISWSHDDEAPKETTTFEYGGMLIRYCQQNANGSLNTAIPGGWNRVKNIQDHTTNPIGG